MFQSKLFCFQVSGRRALFSDPVNRIGGEKMSYYIPTYEALKGITESIYWKPTLIWHIKRARIMNRIQTEVLGIRPIHYDNKGNEQSYYTYLRNVRYKVEVYFEWNSNRPDLQKDWNVRKHEAIFRRALERGGRRDIFLGTRECQGYVEPSKFGEDDGAYDAIDSIDFGFQFHSFIYPDEQEGLSGAKSAPWRVNLWRSELKKGILDYPQPEDCKIYRDLEPRAIKTFSINNNYQIEEEQE